ncbi:hypothetical protein RUM43_003989 [Polyplax serrata]|uniref:Uncharacterized protein n=1 Tax=Polyplax serrata TaxID=468196 RepID=A0AAN8SAF0_POLSC
MRKQSPEGFTLSQRFPKWLESLDWSRVFLHHLTDRPPPVLQNGWLSKPEIWRFSGLGNFELLAEA